MRIKVLAISIAITLGFLIGAASTTVAAEQDNPIKIWPQNANGNYETMVVVDEETGVNYIVVGRHSITYSYDVSDTVAIVPRYNSDGSLFIS